jgi:short-subunit dehydrogenase
MHDRPVALITGASSGIGYETALEFARHGYDVCGTSRSVDRLNDLHHAISTQLSGDLLPLAADVQSASEVQSVVDATVERFGRLDVLVANAGVGHRGSVVAADWADVDTLLRTNIDGALHTVRAGIPVMQKQGSGHIVLISSVTYNMPVPYGAYYAASKAFISSMARSLRMELAPDNIHVTDMVVGRTDTNFNANRLGGERTGSRIPSMTPDRVAQGLVRAVQRKQRTVVLRLFDRLTVIGSIVLPDLVGRIALRQYK